YHLPPNPAISPLSLHDALPIFHKLQGDIAVKVGDKAGALAAYRSALELDRGYVQVWLDLGRLHEEKEELSEARKAYERALDALRSEEHTSELQSLAYLVCRLLL